MVDTVHVQRNIKYNEEKGIRDFYLSRHPSGEVATKDCISLDEAANLLNIKILQRDALDKNLWMPDSAPPDLPQPLESMWAHQINNMKWMLSKTSLKMG